MRIRVLVALLLLSVGILSWESRAIACPFCSAIANTLSEDLSKSDVAVVAKWLDTDRNRKAVARSLTTNERDTEDPLALKDFEVTRVYKSGPKFKLTRKRIEATFRGQPEPNRIYLVFGFADEVINWTTAVPLRPESLAYLDELPTLPEPGPTRLKHFLAYLDHPEKALADDAYNEFARAPYSDVQGLRTHLDRKWLLARIEDPRSDARRRQLYLTLLGVCGVPADAAVVLKVMEKLETSQEPGLDAAIACYLTLTKAQGLAEIERRYLARTEVADQAIMAIRFHGEEAKIIPRRQLGAALQKVLDRPLLAEQVIPDLARWEIWNAAKPLAQLFRTSTGPNASVRIPVARFLTVCPTPEAKLLLAELEKIDAAAVRRVNMFMPVPLPDAG